MNEKPRSEAPFPYKVFTWPLSYDIAAFGAAVVFLWTN